MSKILFLCDLGEGDRFGEPVQGEDVFCRLCRWYKYLVASVVFRGRTYVETLCAVWSKSRTLGRGVVDEDLGAGNCKGGAIKIEIAEETGMG